MKEFSLLIGGKAGDGINQTGNVMAKLLANLGYYVYMYYDYPSLIRGGHNFAVVRASDRKILTHRSKIDCLIALNQDTVEYHKEKLNDKAEIIFDSSKVESEGLGLDLSKIIKEEKEARPVMRNSIIIGAFAKTIGVEWEMLEKLFKKHMTKETKINLALAGKGYENAETEEKLDALKRKKLPVLTGNEVVGLGLVAAGLDSYVAYPMTPSSNILHFLAKVADKFNLKVVHPESEIAVILMALGFAYGGERVAVGTSGGGFCLMTEGLSMAGMSESPVVIVESQRPGPSTGIPTYSGQGDLGFVLSAGQGEFVRLVVAPGDAEEAYCWSGTALNMAWKYQIASVILIDKALSEGTFSFDREEAKELKKEEVPLWDGKGVYRRYLETENGVSPLAFPGQKTAVVKTTSYEHDEFGLTTEEPEVATDMYDKRMRKEKYLSEELEKLETVKTYGKADSSTALLCWGSNKGAALETAEKLNLRLIQPVILSPFPVKRFKEALKGVEKLILVESNATAQLAQLLKKYDLNIDEKILKYDGRPFTVEELEAKVKEVQS